MVVRGGATKGPLVSWILDVYTLVHNYLVLGYKNENNSGLVSGTQTFSAEREGLGTELRKPSHFGM